MTVSVTAWVAVPVVFVAVTVNDVVGAPAVGVPVSAPAADKFIPVGTAPVVTANVIAAGLPVAVNA